MLDCIKVPHNSRLAHIDPDILAMGFGAFALIMGEGRPVEEIADRYGWPPAALAGVCFQIAMAVAQDVAPALKDFVPDDPIEAANFKAALALNASEQGRRPDDVPDDPRLPARLKAAGSSRRGD